MINRKGISDVTASETLLEQGPAESEVRTFMLKKELHRPAPKSFLQRGDLKKRIFFFLSLFSFLFLFVF